MPRKWSSAVPEGNGSVPHHDEVGPDQPTMADLYRMIEELFDRSVRKLDELTEKIRATRQCSAGLVQDARQPRFATETDVPTDTKTRKRTEDAAADRVMIGDSSSALVDPDSMCLTSFGDDSPEPPILPCCRNDAIVDKGAAAPKPPLSPVEMRTLTATGGLFPAGTASTATRTIFHQLPFWFCLTEEMNSRTSTQYAPTYYRSF